MSITHAGWISNSRKFCHDTNIQEVLFSSTCTTAFAIMKHSYPNWIQTWMCLLLTPNPQVYHIFRFSFCALWIQNVCIYTYWHRDSSSWNYDNFQLCYVQLRNRLTENKLFCSWQPPFKSLLEKNLLNLELVSVDAVLALETGVLPLPQDPLMHPPKSAHAHLAQIPVLW